MTPDLTDLADQISLSPYQAIGIPIALVGAVFLALGAQFQHRGVGKVDAASAATGERGLSPRQLILLLRRPSWVLGTVMLGLAVVLQLTSLYFAPLIVVQPLGAVALVITAIVNARVSHVKLDAISIRAITLCVGGVALFVTVAAFNAKSKPVTERELVIVLVILAVVLVAFALLFALLRNRITPIFYIVGAGVLFGFVATLAKVVIDRLKTLALTDFDLTPTEWLTGLCIAALIAASALGSYFVQTAYSSGPPDLVVAGLTVIDPVVAVSIGVVVLGEAAGAPAWSFFAFLIAGAVAIYGVFQLAKHHPQTNR
ncbi:magnesium transporter NIPA [Glaciihabitans tibetensis]|uniref:Magnesium transporter NIPA n=1 Tax=Glaciihabitans tibetensis TaxID=1266600 RepID=A0A2T0VJ76_9MICO|nr:DMT family transporter [Glaciihabitans tibetensis]PRY70258.1 magnesium transporter NIPA [Glaciihabitans tibetensis]